MYTVAGMTDKNKDVLLKDLLDLVGSSSNQFLQGLFPDRPDPNSKKRPPTAGDKIKVQSAVCCSETVADLTTMHQSSANALVEKLMRSQPSYIRTIKPNQNKSPTEYDSKAILHQIKYLGLQENIRVRRAGFAYRNTFEKMVERFYLLSPSTSYAGEYTWQGDAKTGCERILRDTGIAKEEWQMGTTKAFIKNPETVRFSFFPAYTYSSDPVTTALRARAHARPVLAQHGRPDPARVPQLHSIQARVRNAHPALLDEQEGRDRVRPGARLRPLDPRQPQGAPPVQSAQHAPLHGRLPRCRRGGLAGAHAQERRRHLGCAVLYYVMGARADSVWIAQERRSSRSARGRSCSSPSSAGRPSRALDTLSL